MNKEKIIQVGSDLIRKFQWDWYASLTFEEPITRRQALQRFNCWILKLEIISGSRVEYILVIENHKLLGSIPHLNVLLCGLKNENPLMLLYEWTHTIGVGEIMRYEPGQGAHHYIARKLANKNAEVIFSKGVKSADKIKSI